MKIIGILWFTVLWFQAFGCEVCGCSTSAGSIGIIGASNYHLVGFNFGARAFNSAHPDIFGHGNDENSSEFFIQVSLLAKFQLSKRFQLYTSIPYLYNQQRKSSETAINHGLGDISISTRYTVVQKVDTVSKRALSFQLGAGIKAPTGNYSIEAHETTNMYAGTGSWDFPFNANLFYQTEKWNFQFENLFNLTTENKAGYKFGNAIQSALYAGRQLKSGRVTISPGIGIQSDYMFHARIDGSDLNTFNGGYLMNIVPGINFEMNGFFASIRYYHPITQELSKGYTKNVGQLSASIYYTFKTKKL